MKPAIAALLLVVGCATSSGSPCSPAAEARIEAAYVAEALQLCTGKTYLTCPELPSLREKYRTKREEWIRCHR